jgi:hypothetical protein
LNGSGIETDSYDPTQPGVYSDANGNYSSSKARDHGDLVTDSTSSVHNYPAIDVGNGSIKGKVRTGPGGLVNLGPGASVGDLAWVNGGTAGIKQGWQTDDVNVSLPDVQAPFATGASLPAPAPKGPNYTLPTGDYYVAGDLKLNGTTSTNLLITGTVRLYVTGNLTVNGAISIQPGATLQLFVGGTDVANPTASKVGAVYDETARALQYFGLPNNISVSFSGNNSFLGEIFAPEATMKCSGGGSGGVDFCGSYMVNSMVLNGHYKFHYDESLASISTYRGFVAISWQEQ